MAPVLTNISRERRDEVAPKLADSWHPFSADITIGAQVVLCVVLCGLAYSSKYTPGRSRRPGERGAQEPSAREPVLL